MVPDAYSGRYVPFFLAVVVGHDLTCDTGLALTGTQGKTKALKDDGTEIGQLFDLVDGKWRRNVGKSRVKLGSQLRENFGVGKKMNGHYLEICQPFPFQEDFVFATRTLKIQDVVSVPAMEKF